MGDDGCAGIRAAHCLDRQQQFLESRKSLEQYDIVTRLEGRTYPDPHLFREAMSDVAPGKPVALEVLRAGTKLTVQVTPVPLE